MHKYLCIDESGTFNSIYERYYIMSAIITDDVESLQTLHQKMETLVRRNRSTKELKASSLKDDKKAIFINALLENDYLICAIALDKKILFQYNEYNISEFFIYNYTLKELLTYIDSLHLLDNVDDLLILVDSRSMNHKIYLELESYLNLEFFERFRKLKVFYKDSATNREIQMADYVSNMFYGKLNKTNEAYLFIDNLDKINLKVIPHD